MKLRKRMKNKTRTKKKTRIERRWPPSPGAVRSGGLPLLIHIEGMDLDQQPLGYERVDGRETGPDGSRAS